MSTTEEATKAPSKFMKPKPYRRVDNDEDDALPQVAVKDKKTFTSAEVEQIAKDVENKTEDRALNPEEEVWKKRYADLRSHQQKQENEFKKQIADLNARVAKVTDAPKALPKSPEEVAQWAAQYPEVYALVRSVAANESDDRVKALEAQIDSLVTRVHVEEHGKAKAELARLHPDVDIIGADPKFHAWVATKPKVFQDALYENDDPQAAADVITLYKTEKGLGAAPTTPKNNEALEASRAVTPTKNADVAAINNSDGVIKESWIKSLRPQEFDKYEEMIDEATRNGKVIYDVSNNK